MPVMMINNRKVEFTNEKNILAVIRKAGIDLPTFCYHSELSTFGACRMCVVEDDRGRIMTSCTEPPRDGMIIYTNTLRLQKHRRMIIELLLASHCTDCTTCVVNGDCTLQKLAKTLGIKDVRFENNKKKLPIDKSSDSIVLDPNKCILCGDCVRTCDEIQGVGILDFAYRGSNVVVAPAFGKKLSETQCVGCGQCRIVCPTGAITVKYDVDKVWEAIGDPTKRVVAQIAPAVRVAIGDKFGIPKGQNCLGRLVAALRRIGFDEVYDTNFGADLTVMEESQEFLERLESGENLPLLTSCCPGWVKFCENKYPEFRKNVSTCRSPMQMVGAILKEEARVNPPADGRETIVVAIMPCTAKKSEIKRPEHFTDGVQDVDYVVTTAELTSMIQEAGVDLATLEDESLDMPFGIASGSGAIFGATGGVTEAVLRRLVNSSKAEDLEAISFMGVRGTEGLRECTVNYKGKELHIAIVNGLRTASEVLEKVKSGESKYHFIEIMACKRGCVAGGGQPFPVVLSTKDARLEGLYKTDKRSLIKLSSENPLIDKAYNGILQGKVHKLLHNGHSHENH
ncbi:MAG: (2Fe-2S)-binding protein [Clostridia bacterium]|nr:(2Fe-2S)-binding protein [Clostridia bacterium]MBQ9924865.1 (2Fe-2S)-binding protein [Clostridia bacterium]